MWRRCPSAFGNNTIFRVKDDNRLFGGFDLSFQSKNCWMNKLAISRGGRIDLEDVEFYCGQGTLDIVSTSNSINVVLLTSYSPGGYFYCTVTVKKKQPSPSGCSCGYKNSVGSYISYTHDSIKSSTLNWKFCYTYC